jgi:hypothetical protein
VSGRKSTATGNAKIMSFGQPSGKRSPEPTRWIEAEWEAEVDAFTRLSRVRVKYLVGAMPVNVPDTASAILRVDAWGC